MDKIFKDLSTIEKEQAQVEKIQSLKEALDSAKKEHQDHVKKSIEHISGTFKDKLKHNKVFSNIVTNYVNKYVKDGELENAEDELYNILTGEMVSLFDALLHSSFLM